MKRNTSVIDLRSDTVTQPTDTMRDAMSIALVGDDVYGEDPTVNKLQKMAAERMGKEAGLFVSSGTMGNLAAVLSYCARGDEVILGNKSHTFLYEAGGVSVLGGVHSHQLTNQIDGSLAPDDIENAIRPDDPHDPVSRLICLENTHNRCGGTCLSPEYMQIVSDLAHEHGLKVHLDGARIFNAAIAQNIDVRKLTDGVDSVTFCLSKGLCAPVGSVLCGSKRFVKKANRIRKLLGGGMRQAGVLAAAGIVALETMVDRLEEDHAMARKLASGLQNIPGLEIPGGVPETNMVFISLGESFAGRENWVQNEFKNHGILIGISGKRQIRLVTHYGINKEDINKTCEAFCRIFSAK